MKWRGMVCALLLAALLMGLAAPALASEQGKLMRVDHCGHSVALRRLASEKSRRVAKLPRGSVVLAGPARNGYRLARWGDKWGFVQEKYLEPQNRALRLSKGTWLRRSPGGKGGKLKKLKRGAVVLAASEGDNGWFYVCAGGDYGYVNAKYLRAATLNDGRMAMVLEDATLRDADGSARARVSAGAFVTSFGPDGRGNEYVYYEGRFGFISQNRLLHG